MNELVGVLSAEFNTICEARRTDPQVPTTPQDAVKICLADTAVAAQEAYIQLRISEIRNGQPHSEDDDTQ